MQWSQRKPILRISEMKGKPVVTHGREITLIGRVFQVNWSGGAFLWQRPVVIEVRQGNVVRRLSIHNATRRATTGIILAGLTITVATTLWMRLKNSRSRRSS
jgi:hypothetical protein